MLQENFYQQLIKTIHGLIVHMRILKNKKIQKKCG